MSVQRLVAELSCGWAPPAKLSVTGWADEYRFLSSESGSDARKWHMLPSSGFLAGYRLDGAQFCHAASRQSPCGRPSGTRSATRLACLSLRILNLVHAPTVLFLTWTILDYTIKPPPVPTRKSKVLVTREISNEAVRRRTYSSR